MILEGVPYYPFVVRFRLTNGKRRRWVRWSPGHPWVRNEVARELIATFGDEIKNGSVTIRARG